jgi:hypothetical protein
MIPTQVFFFIMSIAAGCYLCYAGEKFAYFAVMKRAPSLGVLWIWSIIELQLVPALSSLSIVAAYFWSQGFSIF